MGQRYRPQPKDPSTGKYVPAWEVRGRRIYQLDLWTSYADPEPEFATPFADRLEALWTRLRDWVKR